jgi:hypothetical protein
MLREPQASHHSFAFPKRKVLKYGQILVAESKSIAARLEDSSFFNEACQVFTVRMQVYFKQEQSTTTKSI